MSGKKNTPVPVPQKYKKGMEPPRREVPSTPQPKVCSECNEPGGNNGCGFYKQFPEVSMCKRCVRHCAKCQQPNGLHDCGFDGEKKCCRRCLERKRQAYTERRTEEVNRRRQMREEYAQKHGVRIFVPKDLMIRNSEHIQLLRDEVSRQGQVIDELKEMLKQCMEQEHWCSSSPQA